MTRERLTVGSTFSGVGGADLGFVRAGFDIKWMCELDAWKRSILAAHYPDVTLHDDITTLNDPPPVDVMIGGFPCQDLSVAGKRKGFTGERSVLAFEFLRIAESIAPRWIVLENVPGLLSSNGGKDFARLVDEMVGCGYGVAWRILDARYFAVPQRRRRVFIVARRADAEFDTRGASRLALRALWESSGGDSTPGWPPREITPTSSRAGVTSGSVGTHGNADESVTGTLTRMYSEQSGQDYMGGAGVIAEPIAATLTSGSHPSSNMPGRRREDDVNLVAEPLAYRKSKRAVSDTDDETRVADGAANTLNAFDAGDTRTTHVIAHGVSSGDSDVAGTLCTNSQGGQRTTDIAGAYVSSVAEQKTFSVYPEGGNGADIAASEVEISPALMKTKSERGVHVAQGYSIREDNASNTFSATPIDAARCLQKHQPSINSHHAQNIITQQTSAFKAGQGAQAGSIGYEDEMSPTLTAAASGSNQVPTIHQQNEVHVAFNTQFSNQATPSADGVMHTLDRNPNAGVATTMSVRRLTPVECERLMGWPDDWTAPPGVKAPDSKRYAACGDGIVSWVAYWIAQRIRMIEEETSC